MKKQAERSTAVWLGDPGKAKCLYFFCHHCDAESVAVPLRVRAKLVRCGQRLPEEYATALCPACRKIVNLRLVGWHFDESEPTWRIDGPEITNHPKGGE